MDFAFAFVGAPIMAYLVLAVLPRGRPALVGILVAAAATAVIWVTQIRSDDRYFVAIVTFVFSAVVLAGLVQLLRVAIGDGRPRWVYPAMVILVLLAAGLPIIYELGR